MKVQEITPDEWNSLVDECPQGTIFSTTKWMALFGQQCKLYGVFKGQELVGGWGGFSSPQPLTPFQSILVKESGLGHTSVMSRQIEVTKALMDVLPAEFYNHYTFPDVRPFKWAGGWQIDVRYTYVVDISKVNEAYLRLDKDTRNAISKAEENHIIIQESMVKFYQLYQETFKRKNLLLPVESEFLAKFTSRFFPLIYCAGDTMAVFILDSKRAYYILGASGISQNLTPFVLWESFMKLSGMGIKEVDLCGANGEKIAFYKRGFGGNLMSYFGVKRCIEQR